MLNGPFSSLSCRWQLVVGVFFLMLVLAAESPGKDRQNADLPSPISSSEIAQAQQFGQSLGIADWLGPLAPVALSPFFGIACLSAMALYGQGWVSADNAFLGEASPLNNQTVFVVFLVLTVLTSLPRLTKVSKPFAQAVDQVEAWAGIITMLTLKYLIQNYSAAEMALTSSEHFTVAQMSPLTFTVSTLLAVAAIINVVVINTVKFFFEVLIWITPIPAIDALFEVANKTICMLLMAIYGYSPVLATGINVFVFLVAAVAFRWVYRREVFFRTMLLDACWAWVSPPKSTRDHLVVFPAEEFGPFPARSRCRLEVTDSGWRLLQQGLLNRDVVVEMSRGESHLELDAGYFTNTLKIAGQIDGRFTFSRFYNAQLPALAERFHATLNAQDVEARKASRSRGLKAELS